MLRLSEGSIIIKKQREKYDLCIPNTELGFLGHGYPLFFLFIKHSIWILLSIFLISGIFSLSTNYNGKFCMSKRKYQTMIESISDKKEKHKFLETHCVLTFASKFSIANQMNDKKDLEIQSWLNLITVIFLVIFVQFLRYRQRKMSVKCDDIDDTTNDYTVQVSNIPLNMSKEELMEHLEMVASKGRDKRRERTQKIIRKINYAYNLDELEKMEKEKKEILKELKKVNKDDRREILRVKYRLSLKKSQIQDHKESLESKQGSFLGIAFVTFNWKRDKDEFLENFGLENHYEEIIATFSPDFVYREKLECRGNHLHICEASFPTDVIWQNLDVPIKNQIFYRIFVGILGFMVVAAGAWIIFLLYYIQIKAFIEFKGNTFVVQLIAIAISLLVIAFNFFLKILYAWGAKKERYHRKSKEIHSFAFNLSISMFINSAIVQFCIAIFYLHNFSGSGGLITNQFTLFFTMALSSLAKEIINPKYLWRLFRRKRQIQKGVNSTLTQDEAQRILEDPEFKIGKAYAYIIKNVLFTAFYSYILPMGVLIMIVYLLLIYWVFKYNILFRSTVKVHVDKHLSLKMTNLLELICVIYPLSNLLFENYILHRFSTEAVVGMIIGSLNFFLPSNSINEYLFEVRDSFEDDMPFDEALPRIFTVAKLFQLGF